MPASTPQEVIDAALNSYDTLAAYLTSVGPTTFPTIAQQLSDATTAGASSRQAEVDAANAAATAANAAATQAQNDLAVANTKLVTARADKTALDVADQAEDDARAKLGTDLG